MQRRPPGRRHKPARERRSRCGPEWATADRAFPHGDVREARVPEDRERQVLVVPRASRIGDEPHSEKVGRFGAPGQVAGEPARSQRWIGKHLAQDAAPAEKAPPHGRSRRGALQVTKCRTSTSGAVASPAGSQLRTWLAPSAAVVAAARALRRRPLGGSFFTLGRELPAGLRGHARRTVVRPGFLGAGGNSAEGGRFCLGCHEGTRTNGDGPGNPGGSWLLQGTRESGRA